MSGAGDNEISRRQLADEIDAYEAEIKTLNEGKADTFKSYRAQLEAGGMEPRRASAELAATKAAIARRRKLREDPTKVREKDDLTDEILDEIMDSPSRARESIQSEPASPTADQASEAEPQAASLANPLQEGSEPIEAHNLDRAGSTPAPATSHPTLGVGGSGESPGEATEEAARAPASSVVPITRDIRPWCLHKNDLSKCGGYGRQHCHSCLKAHADESGEAA